MLIELDDKIVSSEIFSKKFVCDLSRCKGACCVEGDAGAPLNMEEVENIQNNLDSIIPFMNDKGLEAVKKSGVYYLDDENEPVTTLVDGKECAFVHFDINNIAFCAIETAFLNNKIDNIKPISCSLYPIRVKKYQEFQAINFDEWEICSPACECGNELSVPVYKFLKAPLIRAFGSSFYNELCQIEQEIQNINE